MSTWPIGCEEVLSKGEKKRKAGGRSKEGEGRGGARGRKGGL
jgi:hypothetical protein